MSQRTVRVNPTLGRAWLCTSSFLYCTLTDFSVLFLGSLGTDQPPGEPGKDDEKEGGFFSKLKKTFCHEDDADEKRRHAGKEGTSDGRKADDGAK